MPKLANEMGALAVSKVSTPGLHFVGYVTGLALQVKGTGAKSWILRSVIGGRRRDMGLGAYPSVSLAHARQKAAEARELIRQGVDPIERQRSALSALKASIASQLTFEETAKAYMSAHETTWKNAKHAQQWRNTLKEYAYPPPPPLRPTKGTSDENFSRKRNRRKPCLSSRVSNSPPHTKFTVIPSRAITDPRINTRKPLLLLLGAIGIHASVHGICYPSQRRLAFLCGRSPSWAFKYLHELISLGYVKRLSAPHPRAKRSALRIQVMWSVTQPLPPKECDWKSNIWCWQ